MLGELLSFPFQVVIHFFSLKSHTFMFLRASSGSPLAGEKVDVLLERMKALSMLPEYDVRPDVISFNTCIKGD